MMRFRLMLAIAALALCSSCTSDDEPRRGNVVLIVSDALRQDALACYGGEAETPNIDRLAAAGVLFSNAYSNGPWTSPSSVAMFTGNYATTYHYKPTHKTVTIHVPDEEILFSEVLGALGYATFGRVDNAHARMHNNLQGLELTPRGDQYRRVTTPELREEISSIIGQEADGPRAYKNLFILLARLLEVEPEQPFFMVCWMIDPHSPYRPIDQFKQRIDIDAFDLPKPPNSYGEYRHGIRELSPAEHAFMKRLYLAEVESVDERVGFIVETLRHKGVLDDTYIIFTSDHGEQFGEHDEWGHGAWGRKANYYDVLVRIPLIMSGPGIPRGKRRSDLVSLVDLMPTLVDFFGLDYPHDMQGLSFRSILKGRRDKKRFVYLSDVRPHDHVDALRQGNTKLIARADDEFELYDLSNDPAETTDIAANKPKRVRQLAQKLREVRAANEQLRSTRGEGLPAELSAEEQEELIEELKALGYIK